MRTIISSLCLLVLAAHCAPLAAQVNPYKDGTPGVTGYRSEVLAEVIATLKDSFSHAKGAIKAMPDADLDKSMDWFGGKNTERGVLLFSVRHTAEHLGQSIAYARFAGIVPPWTEDAQKKAAEKTKDKQ